MRDKGANGSAAHHGDPFVVQVWKVEVPAVNKLTTDLLDG
ncbi:Unknown protein sequence [Pseudomonas syringae pv. broussonetiae]|nr:Unknown protein sequence [Pseudomonas syringae pv. broussonetiae]